MCCRLTHFMFFVKLITDFFHLLAVSVKFKQWLKLLQDKIFCKNPARYLRNTIITQYLTEKLRSINIKLYPISVSPNV